MKALVYHGPMDVRIDDKPKPKIQQQDDIILKVTIIAICGSDLHLYHGSVEGMEPGQTLGHEFMGIVEDVGTEVHEVKQGDRIVLPFNINCGRCWYCRHQLWSQCDNLTYLDSLNRYIVLWSYKVLTGLSEKRLVSTKSQNVYNK
jgi:S-(hydroxymethyl)glutathione dehydrogenase/alcohol dehydrogenase